MCVRANLVVCVDFGFGSIEFCGRYYALSPDGTDSPWTAPGGANGGESGLDNGPTVEGVPFNETGVGVQDQYDPGITGMYLMDTLALVSTRVHTH